MARKPGRPNAYEERIKPRIDEIILWARAGATNTEIASALGVGKSTFLDHLARNKELSDSLAQARMSGVPEVKMALLKRALGFEYEEKKISVRVEDGEKKQYIETTRKQALPDVGAIQVYLRNYTDDFRDRDKVTYDFKELELELKKMLAEQNNF